MKLSIRPLVGSLVVLSTMALAACNTMEGVGEDVEEAGESVQDAADDN